MAFDVGHRPYESQPPPPERKTLADHADVVLRAIVLLPLLGLCAWWVVSILRDVLAALTARLAG
jgi:hypothetical protein